MSDYRKTTTTSRDYRSGGTYDDVDRDRRDRDRDYSGGSRGGRDEYERGDRQETYQRREETGRDDGYARDYDGYSRRDNYGRDEIRDGDGRGAIGDTYGRTEVTTRTESYGRREGENIGGRSESGGRGEADLGVRSDIAGRSDIGFRSDSAGRTRGESGSREGGSSSRTYREKTTVERSTYRPMMTPRSLVIQRTAYGGGPMLSSRSTMYGGRMGGGRTVSLERSYYGGGRGLAPESYGAMTHSGVSSMMESREREKRDMQDLNERFASYIEKVRFLEAQNRKLADELEKLRANWGKETSAVKAMFQTELEEARKLLDNSEKDKGRLEIRVATLEEQLEESRMRENDLRKEADDWRTRCEKQDIQLSDQDAEIALLKRKITGFEMDKDKEKKQVVYLTDALNRARMDLDSETLLHIDAENRYQSMEEEFEFLKAIHEQEMKELAALAYRDTTPENREFWKNEMGQALREIQQVYDDKLDNIRGEMEFFYNTKIQEFTSGPNRERMMGDTSKNKEESKRMRTYVSEITDKMSTLDSKNSSLIRELENLRRDRDEREREWETENGDLKIEVSKLRAELEAIMRELQNIMTAKMGLELEIAAYRKLLETEETRLSRREYTDGAITGPDRYGGGGGGGGYSGGKDYGGKDYGGKDPGGKDYGGKDYGGKDYGDKDYGGKDYGGKDYGGKDYGGKDYGGKDAGGKIRGGGGYSGGGGMSGGGGGIAGAGGGNSSGSGEGGGYSGRGGGSGGGGSFGGDKGPIGGGTGGRGGGVVGGDTGRGGGQTGGGAGRGGGISGGDTGKGGGVAGGPIRGGAAGGGGAGRGGATGGGGDPARGGGVAGSATARGGSSTARGGGAGGRGGSNAPVNEPKIAPKADSKAHSAAPWEDDALKHQDPHVERAPSRTSFQRSSKGPVSVADCAPDGKFITLENTGQKDEFIGGWNLNRVVDDREKVQTVFPTDLVIRSGEKIRIWARGCKPFNAPPSDVESSVATWGVGANAATKLANMAGDERAAHIQKTTF